MEYCLYLASAPVYQAMGIAKIGESCNLYARQRTYQTGCPPGLTPSHDIDYLAAWVTDAKTPADIQKYESIVHDHFIGYRMLRRMPGDSEWFRFPGEDWVPAVREYMAARKWVVREKNVAEICPAQDYLFQKNYKKNLENFLSDREERNEALRAVQAPVVEAIQRFMADPALRAGVVVAPCGSGKTRMAAEGLRGAKRGIVCCPSRLIQGQWKDTLVEQAVFSATDVHFVGDFGTTDVAELAALMARPTYCLVTTYASCKLLAPLLTAAADFVCCDEAHHMVGAVAEADSGTGVTRKLLKRATELNVKCLSLTFTPRYCAKSAEMAVLTMDDAAVFGPTIAELKLRELIRLGVLPDYRIWTLRGDGAGLAAKAECVLRAWSSTEMVKSETGRKEQPILNHLILYARTGEEAKELAEFFRARTTVVLLLSGDDAKEKVAEFQGAPRAILVNCKMLNEGVDIPAADSVAIMYPKQAHWEIVQMLLRAGRWHPTKAVFHLLLPLLGGEDLAAYQEVLLGLASCDEQVREDFLVLEASAAGGGGQGRGAPRAEATTTCIIDHFGSTTDDVLQCFKAVRKALSLPGMLRDVQGWCAENRVDSSEAYRRHREDYPELPEDPVPWTQTWFDWLHPGAAKLPLTEFERVLEKAGLQSARAYASWREGQEAPSTYPEVQHVNDGYFGGHTNFTTLFKAPRTR